MNIINQDNWVYWMLTTGWPYYLAILVFTAAGTMGHLWMQLCQSFFNKMKWHKAKKQEFIEYAYW